MIPPCAIRPAARSASLGAIAARNASSLLTSNASRGSASRRTASRMEKGEDMVYTEGLK